MGTIDWENLQNNSEINCVQKFLPEYNKRHKCNFANPRKDDQQNEIDIYCTDDATNREIAIQVKKADHTFARKVGQSRIKSSSDKFTTRDGDQIVERILQGLQKVEGKYEAQDKDMSEIILLLDEMTDPPTPIMQQIQKGISSSIFKEIWIVTGQGRTYLLYERKESV